MLYTELPGKPSPCLFPNPRVTIYIDYMNHFTKNGWTMQDSLAHLHRMLGQTLGDRRLAARASLPSLLRHVRGDYFLKRQQSTVPEKSC
jgi:hypothetical protein